MKEVQIGKIYSILKKETKKYDTPYAHLVKVRTNEDYRTLVSTILSARTRDETTARVSEQLFSKAGNLKGLNKLSLKQIEKIIKPVNYYKTKSKNLKKLASVVDKEFNGRIPCSVEELIRLPGVGRKTANLVSSVVFNKDAVYVDTHVHRIMNRFGYVSTKTPEKTEKELRKKLPKKYWREISEFLVVFGQNLCKPQIPLCSKCPVSKYCYRINVVRSR
ncbi:MAG: endonuclease III [Candidatus Nanoarchaeia archaeon]|nr:endonuclease III [Candidatus Nanoarchaeia archaeon]